MLNMNLIHLMRRTDMSWWKKFTGYFSKNESVPKIEVNEVKHLKNKDKMLKEETEKATVTLKPLHEAIERGAVETKKSKPKTKPKRARNKGKFVADDKSTPDINEAWAGGKAPKKRAPKKPKSKATRVKRRR